MFVGCWFCMAGYFQNFHFQICYASNATIMQHLAAKKAGNGVSNKQSSSHAAVCSEIDSNIRVPLPWSVTYVTDQWWWLLHYDTTQHKFTSIWWPITPCHGQHCPLSATAVLPVGCWQPAGSLLLVIVGYLASDTNMSSVRRWKNWEGDLVIGIDDGIVIKMKEVFQSAYVLEK